MTETDMLSSLLVSDVIAWMQIALLVIAVLLLARYLRIRGRRRVNYKNFRIITWDKRKNKPPPPRIYGRVRYGLSEGELTYYEEQARKRDKDGARFKFVDGAPTLIIEGGIFKRREIAKISKGTFVLYMSYNDGNQSSRPDRLVLILEPITGLQFPVVHIDHHLDAISRAKQLTLPMDAHVRFKRRRYSISVVLDYDF